MEFDGALSDVEPAGDFFIGKIFKERIEHFLLAAAEVGDGVSLEATPLAAEDRIDEAGEQLARPPETSIGHEWQGANQLVTRLNVGQKAFDSEAEERKTVGFIVVFSNNDEARFGAAVKKVGEESARRGGRPA